MGHTPGPWKISEILIGDYDPDDENPDRRELTHCVVTEIDENKLITYDLPSTFASDEFMDNAHLIAAAPSLLSVCTNALRIFERIQADIEEPLAMPWPIIQELDEALARAKGE